MIEKMKEQDCDKKKSISQGKKHNIFYKMIMSRRAFGITYFVYGATVLSVLAERAEILSSTPSVGSRIFLLLSICFPFAYGTYLLCTKDKNSIKMNEIITSDYFKRVISHKWNIIICLMVIVVCLSFVVIFSDRNWEAPINFNLPSIIVGSVTGYLLGVLIRRVLRRNNTGKKSFKLIFECVGSLCLKVSDQLEESVFTIDWDSSIIPPSIGDDFEIEEFIPGLNWNEKQRLYSIYGHATVIERSFYKKEHVTYISIVLMDSDEIQTMNDQERLLRIKARRKPATATGKRTGGRAGAVMPDKKEDLPPADLKADLYAELNKEARKADYIPYSPDKLIIGQFGKVMHGKENLIEYVLLSDRFLNRQESFETYFYLLSIPTISCGSFHKETGERSEGCKVIEMEVIDEARARERYRRFLAVWKE